MLIGLMMRHKPYVDFVKKYIINNNLVEVVKYSHRAFYLFMRETKTFENVYGTYVLGNILRNYVLKIQGYSSSRYFESFSGDIAVMMHDSEYLHLIWCSSPTYVEFVKNYENMLASIIQICDVANDNFVYDLKEKVFADTAVVMNMMKFL